MTIYEKTITLARKYCIDNAWYWRHKYFKDRTGSDLPYTYTANDYNLFPRYNTLDAVLEGVKLLVGKEYNDFNSCIDDLLKASEFETFFTKRDSN